MIDLHICPLCGHKYDASKAVCHTSCPLGASCNLICCPNCGYQVPNEDRMGLTKKLRQLWNMARATQKETR